MRTTATAAGTDVGAARAARIYRLWTRACRRGAPQRWWRDRYFAFASLQLLLPLCAALRAEAFLRRALLGRPPLTAPSWLGSEVPGRGWLVLFALLWPINGWLVSRQVGRRRRGRLAPAARLLLGVAAGTPLAGFVLLPFWRRRVEAATRGERPALPPSPALQSPPWPSPPSPPSPVRRFLRALDRRTRRIEGTYPWVVWLFAVNGLAVWTWLGWCVRPGVPSPERLALVTALVVACHALAAVAAFHHLPLRRGRRTARPAGRLAAAAVALAAPAVLSLPLLAAVALAGQQRTERDAPVAWAHQAALAVSRAPRWLAVDAGLRRRWRDGPWWRRPVSRGAGSLPALASSGRAQRRLVSLLRAKLCSGFLCAVAVGTVAGPDRLLEALRTGLGGWVLVAAAVLAVQCARWALGRLGLGAAGADPATGWSALCAGVALDVGLRFGAVLRGGDAAWAGLAAFTAPAVAVLLLARLLLTPLWHRGKPRVEELGLLIWCFVFCALAVLGAAASVEPRLAAAGRGWWLRLAAAGPGLEVALGLWAGRWMHRRRAGVGAAALRLSLLLPGGVLLAPWWLRQQRVIA